MKKNLIYLTLAFAALIVFNGCNKDEIEDLFPSELVEGCYIINYGNFGNGGASISKFDYNADELTNFYYQQQNNGKELLSNIQYAYPHNDSIYLIGNAVDQLITVNPLMVQTRNGISEQLHNPRFCIASDTYLYISCWGENPDYAEMPNSYIAQFNMQTNQLVTKIGVPGGPEGLEIAHGKLYAALNYKKGIAVIDLSNGNKSEISTPAATSYFVKDNNENLYVTLVSTFTLFSEETGIGIINTTKDQLESVFQLENVSSGYGSVIQANSDFSKIYIVTSSYDANWNLTGAVDEFAVQSKTFRNSPLINDISGISGLSVNPKNNQIYIYSATTATGAGKMGIYSPAGDFVKDYLVGAFPVGAFFLD